MVKLANRHTWRGFLSSRLAESYRPPGGWEECTEQERDDVLDGIGRCLAYAWHQGGLSRQATLLTKPSGRHFPADRHGPAEHPEVEVRGVEPDDWDEVVPASQAFGPAWLSAEGMARLAAVLQTVPMDELDHAAETFRKDQQLDGGAAAAAMVRLTPTRASVQGSGVRVEMNVEADARSAGYF